MKTKSSRQKKSKVARSNKRVVGKKTIRKKTATHRRKTIRKAAVKPEEIRSSTGALESLPEITGADGEGTVDVIEVFEVRVLNPEDDITSAGESEIVPEETEEEAIRWSES